MSDRDVLRVVGRGLRGMCPGVRALLVPGVVVTALAAQSGAQAPAGEAQQPIRTEAHFVRVDVYPTRGGTPVQDLVAADFEVLEDGVPQRVQAFEHVVIRPGGPQTERIDPSSQRESLQAAENPRNRVFVIFLDVPHVSLDASVRIREPLVRMLDRLLGPNDLVGVMTPAMSASSLTLSRNTQTIEAGLMRAWPWGERFEDQLDATEMDYVGCYPKTPCETNPEPYSPLALAMIERKRERATLEALQDLVRYLGAVREERKAILTVTEGWLQMRENPELMKLRQCLKWQEPIPGKDDIQVGPDGKLTTRNRREPFAADKYDCDKDRMQLAAMDNERFLRDIIDEANRANASFYPIDPRGLPVFDTAIGGGYTAPPPVSIDGAMLTRRLDSLRMVAENTDGIAVLNNNDLDRGLRRIADDLSSYYLLGYYSTNTKLDGGFRRLTVRVKRPGIEVRARRGYRAANAEEVAAARRAAEAPAPPGGVAFAAAMETLSRIRPESPFRINAVAAPAGDGPRILWIAGEVHSSASRYESQQGGTVEIVATAGASSSTARITLDPGERTFLTTVSVPDGTTGRLGVKASLASEGGGIPLTDAIQVDLGAIAGQPLLFRRGPSTGNRVRPAADFRFSRTERLRLEVPVGADATPGEARVLDKLGQALKVPVTVAQRVDDAGQRWMTADVVLAPLAPGDYAVEIGTVAGSTSQRVLAAIRITR